MARKSAKKTIARKGSKSAAAKGRKSTAAKGRQSATKAAAEKPARAGVSHVSIGLHGMTNIVKKVHEAGLEPEFNQALEHDDKFVMVQRKSLTKIKEFVASKPELADFLKEMEKCDCPPNDPYCIYI
jgi:hypothetical protein